MDRTNASIGGTWNVTHPIAPEQNSRTLALKRGLFIIPPSGPGADSVPMFRKRLPWHRVCVCVCTRARACACTNAEKD